MILFDSEVVYKTDSWWKKKQILQYILRIKTYKSTLIMSKQFVSYFMVLMVLFSGKLPLFIFFVKQLSLFIYIIIYIRRYNYVDIETVCI